jgi:hypothetical protein
MKCKKFFLLPSLIIVFLLIASAQIFPQGRGTLRGVVVDAQSGEALPYSNVLIEKTNLGTSADLKGNFTITGVPAKDYSIRVSFLGYETKHLNVTIKANQVTQITVELSSSKVELQTIEKIGEKYERPNETDLGLQKLTIRQIEMLPKGVETDIFRSLQFLPGVQTTGDVSARYYVRGGGSNQNLVLLNGVSVYNPFHALGLFSIIDPEMINAVEFYKGGFTAENGGRLSSVLNLVTKDGNKNRYAANANLSFLTGKAAVEGPLGSSGSFLLTGRRTLFNNTLKKFLNFKDAPFEFHDISLKANYSSTGTASLTKLSLHGFNSQDRLLNENPEKADYRWTNNIFGATWFQAWEDVPIYSETFLSISNFEGEVSPNLSDVKPKKNIVSDITFRTDFTNIYESRDEIKVGYKLTSFKSEINLENLQGNRTSASDKGLHFSVYGKYRFLRFEDFGADIGTRINFISLAKKSASFLEPRINLTYNIFPGISLKGAWGIYTQELITLVNEDEIISLFEPWLITPDYLNASEAIHYVGGLSIKLFEGLTFDTEVYYKLLKNTAEINDKKADDIDRDFVQGSGKAYGAEFFVQYLQPAVQFTASYSLSWSYKNVDGWLSYPKYDSRHNVTTNLTVLFGSGWEASVSWFFNSGLPFTQIEGFYDKLYFDDLFYSSGLYGYYKPFTVLGDKNLGRLPTYHRLDLNVTKKFTLFFADVAISASVLNTYDRKNIFYFERDTGERVNMLPILPTATIRIEL